MIPKEQLLKKLYAAHDLCLNTTPTLCIDTLVGFIDELDRVGVLADIKSHAADDKVLATKELCALEKQVLHKLDTQNDEIESYYQERSIEVPGDLLVDHGMSAYRAYRTGKTVSSNLIQSLILAQSNMLSHLMPAGANTVKKAHALIRQFSIIAADGSPRRLADTSLDSLASSFAKVRDFTTSHAILSAEIEYCRNRFYGTAQINDEYDKRLHRNSAILGIVRVLAQSTFKTAKHLAFVEKFAHIDKNGEIEALKIYPLITSWKNELQRIERGQRTTFWYAYEQLCSVYDVYGNFENSRREALERGDLFLEWKLCDAIKKIEAISTGRHPEYADELKLYQKRVFGYAEDLLHSSEGQSISDTASSPSKTISNPADKKKPVTATLNQSQDTITLSTDDEEDSLIFERYEDMKNKQGELQRFSLLLLLCDNLAGFSKDNLLEKLKVEDGSKIITARRGINDRIKEEWRLEELYIERNNKGRLKINEKYATKLSRTM